MSKDRWMFRMIGLISIVAAVVLGVQAQYGACVLCVIGAVLCLSQ